jgi:hypothetical protein
LLLLLLLLPPLFYHCCCCCHCCFVFFPLPLHLLSSQDPAASWWQQDADGGWQGYDWYEQELKSFIKHGHGHGDGPGIASASAGASASSAGESVYGRVLMMGDSMGGSGALLFSHLATRVVSFVPQVTCAVRCGSERGAVQCGDVRCGAARSFTHSVTRIRTRTPAYRSI